VASPEVVLAVLEKSCAVASGGFKVMASLLFIFVDLEGMVESPI
jgi:hypothetical protein